MASQVPAPQARTTVGVDNRPPDRALHQCRLCGSHDVQRASLTAICPGSLVCQRTTVCDAQTVRGLMNMQLMCSSSSKMTRISRVSTGSAVLCVCVCQCVCVCVPTAKWLKSLLCATAPSLALTLLATVSSLFYLSVTTICQSSPELILKCDSYVKVEQKSTNKGLCLH